MTIAQALTLAFQFVNQPMADLAIAEMAQELEGYPQAHVLAALKRCRKELKAIRYGDILDRLPGGHPGPEQAWALTRQAMHDETRSLIWSDEMREAYLAAHAVDDDDVAARMTFKEVYQQAVSASREAKRPIVWTLSKGTDKALLEAVVLEGVKAGQLTAEYAQRQLPNHDLPALQALQLVESMAPRMLK
jgi:hypothetical protein